MQTRAHGGAVISEACRGEFAEPPDEFVVAIIIIVFATSIGLSPPDRTPARRQEFRRMDLSRCIRTEGDGLRG